MKKILQSAKSHISRLDGQHDVAPAHAQDQRPLTEKPSVAQPPSVSDVFRYRYQHGTNLGSIFVLEKWLTPGMYIEGSESAELAAVEGDVKRSGKDSTREKFEKHWETYVSDADLDWLVMSAHCNSVRLPVGYFTLGPAYCHDTPFASVAEVYANAWSAVKKIIARCHSRGIGTLVDLHALPGGANGGDHSGTNSGKAQLWENRSNLDLATRCLLFIVKESKGVAGIVGVQLCNEAEANAKGMYEWYDEVAREVASIDHTVPLYISDGWDLGQAITYCNGKNSLSAGLANPVVIDTHLYWAFSDADKQKTPHQIIDEVPRKLTELDKHDGSVHDHGAAQVVVGEYSCVLSEPTWTKMGNDHKEALVQAFGQAQTRRYQQRAGGSFFWTYRMDWMDGGEWGFKQQCKTNAITAPACFSHSHDDIKTRIKSAREHEKDKMQQTFTTHCHYWDSHYPGQYEHHRFEQGWKLGFDDAEAFYGMRAEGHIAGAGGDKIGLLDIWVKKRLVESGQSGKFVWEFEQGMRQGVRDFYAVVGC